MEGRGGAHTRRHTLTARERASLIVNKPFHTATKHTSHVNVGANLCLIHMYKVNVQDVISRCY